MKSKKLLLLSFCLIVLGCLATSCTEEDVKPNNGEGTWKEGNITGQDDWEKHL